MTATWTCLEPSVASILAADPRALFSLARGEVAALVIRQAVPASQCAELIRFLIAEELMFENDDPRIDEHAIPVARTDRYTQQGLNPRESRRRRIDIGASLGNLGDNPDVFFRRSAEVHALFDRLFADRPNPIAVLYENLRQLAAGKEVTTAYEPDGKRYGPAIIRIHYGGYTYGPHFDSVRLRERRSQYQVHRFEHQFAGVMCLQNATQQGRSAQSIVHRQFWKPEIDELMNTGGFHAYAAQKNVPHVQVNLEPGDLYFFNTGLIHEVPGVAGDLPRVVLATFIGYSEDDPEVFVWS